MAKAFEFRERLWHRPPELQDIWCFDVCDAMQKESKEEGGGQKELDWKVGCLDLTIEREILISYSDWLVDAVQEAKSEKENQFYSKV